MDPKSASPAKKGTAAKGKQVVEEVTDNRPRIVQFKRDFAAENGDQGFRFTEPVACKFNSQFLTISIVDNEQAVESVKISLSELLWSQDANSVSHTHFNLS